jgi:hypothetical protein
MLMRGVPGKAVQYIPTKENGGKDPPDIHIMIFSLLNPNIHSSCSVNTVQDTKHTGKVALGNPSTSGNCQ